MCLSGVSVKIKRASEGKVLSLCLAPGLGKIGWPSL